MSLHCQPSTMPHHCQLSTMSHHCQLSTVTSLSTLQSTYSQHDVMSLFHQPTRRQEAVVSGNHQLILQLDSLAAAITTTTGPLSSQREWCRISFVSVYPMSTHVNPEHHSPAQMNPRPGHTTSVLIPHGPYSQFSAQNALV